MSENECDENEVSREAEELMDPEAITEDEIEGQAEAILCESEENEGADETLHCEDALSDSDCLEAGDVETDCSEMKDDVDTVLCSDEVITTDSDEAIEESGSVDVSDVDSFEDNEILASESDGSEEIAESVSETEQLVNENNRLPVELTFGHVDSIYELLNENYNAAENNQIIVDCSAIEEVDSSGIQLLLALQLKAQQEGNTISWESPPDCLLNEVEILGLNELLPLANETVSDDSAVASADDLLMF